jgi:hypothetical protein
LTGAMGSMIRPKIRTRWPGLRATSTLGPKLSPIVVRLRLAGFRLLLQLRQRTRLGECQPREARTQSSRITVPEVAEEVRLCQGCIAEVVNRTRSGHSAERVRPSEPANQVPTGERRVRHAFPARSINYSTFASRCSPRTTRDRSRRPSPYTRRRQDAGSRRSRTASGTFSDRPGRASPCRSR